jgi:hypothetical protein
LSCNIDLLAVRRTFQFPQRQSVTITTKRLDEVQTINPQLQKDQASKSQGRESHHHHHHHHQQQQHQPSAITQAISTKIPLKKSQLEAKKAPTSVRTIQMSASTGQMTTFTTPNPSSMKAVKESNYTPSISSIGSNVLRSKTADFERMSDSNKKSRISSTMNFPALQTSHNVQSLQAKIQSPPNPNVTNISISLKTTSAPKKKSQASEESSLAATTTTTDVEKKTLPIYKRQEIISSVQNTAKK